MMMQTSTVEQLREAGLKPTRQRIAIADILFKDGHKHISAEDLYSEIERSDMPCLLYTSPSPRDLSTSRMPSSA